MAQVSPVLTVKDLAVRMLARPVTEDSFRMERLVLARLSPSAKTGLPRKLKRLLPQGVVE